MSSYHESLPQFFKAFFKTIQFIKQNTMFGESLSLITHILIYEKTQNGVLDA